MAATRESRIAFGQNMSSTVFTSASTTMTSASTMTQTQGVSEYPAFCFNGHCLSRCSMKDPYPGVVRTDTACCISSMGNPLCGGINCECRMTCDTPCKGQCPCATAGALFDDSGRRIRPSSAHPGTMTHCHKGHSLSACSMTYPYQGMVRTDTLCCIPGRDGLPACGFINCPCRVTCDTVCKGQCGCADNIYKVDAASYVTARKGDDLDMDEDCPKGKKRTCVNGHDPADCDATLERCIARTDTACNILDESGIPLCGVANCLCRITCDTPCNGQCLCASRDCMDQFATCSESMETTQPVLLSSFDATQIERTGSCSIQCRVDKPCTSLFACDNHRYLVNCVRSYLPQRSRHNCTGQHIVSAMAIARCNQGLCGDQLRDVNIFVGEFHSYSELVNFNTCPCRSSCDTLCGGVCKCALKRNALYRLERTHNYEECEEYINKRDELVTNAINYFSGRFKSLATGVLNMVEEFGRYVSDEAQSARCEDEFLRYTEPVEVVYQLLLKRLREFDTDLEIVTRNFSFDLVNKVPTFIDKTNKERWMYFSYNDALRALACIILDYDADVYFGETTDPDLLDTFSIRKYNIRSKAIMTIFG